MYNFMKKQKGITLIEILAIVIILGIVSAITVNHFGNKVKEGELASGINQASLVETALTKYLSDDMKRDIPLVVEGADYIEKPSELDLSLLQNNLSGEINGKFYIYGPYKKVSYDYPESYIEKVYNEYTGNKADLLIQGTQFINTSKLVTLKLIPNEAITSYFLSNNGEIIQMPKDEQYDSVKETAKAKVSTPVITPSKSSPYYKEDRLSFTASSYSSEGGIRYDWEGLNANNQYALGSHTVSVVATDKKGNKSEKASFTFEVVEKPSVVINNPPSKPQITVDPVKNSYKSSDTVKLTALSTDPDGDEVSYVWLNKSADNKYPRGITNVSVYAIDKKGATSPKATIRLIIENGNPSMVGVTQTPSPAYQYDTITLTPKAIDPDDDIITFEWDGVIGMNAGKFQIGQHTYKVRAKDSFDGVSDWYTGKIVISNYLPTEPTISLSPNGNLYANTQVTLTASGSTDRDNHAITYEWVNKKSTYARGTHTVKVRAKDELGGYSQYVEKTIVILNSPPTVPTNITFSPTTIYANTTVSMTASGSTDIDGDTITYDWQNKASKYVKGNHVVKVRAYDGIAYSDWYSKTLTVLNSAPTVTLTINKTSFTIGEAITLTATGSDIDGDTLTYTWKNVVGSNITATKPTKASIPGSNTTTVTVSDGTATATSSVSYNVINNPPTRPVITMTPARGLKNNTSFTLSASGSTDPDGHKIKYVWSGQMSKTCDFGVTTCYVLQNQKYSAGIFEFRVKAVDEYGAESLEAVKIVQVVDANGSGAGGLLLQNANSRIYYPANGYLPANAYFNWFEFTVPSVSGHSGSDYAYVNGYNSKTGQWEQIKYSSTSNGINWLNQKISKTGVYTRLEFFYYASHCMYGKSNITYSMEYEYIID